MKRPQFGGTKLGPSGGNGAGRPEPSADALRHPRAFVLGEWAAGGDVRPYAAPKQQQSETQSEYLRHFQTSHWTHRPYLSPLAQLSGFFLCFCAACQVVDAPFQVGAFRRGRCDRRGKSSGPPLLKLSLKVKRNSAHSQSSAFVVAPVSQPQRAWSLKGPSQT